MKKLNILVVDDEVNITKSLSTLLEMHNYAVTSTNDPLEVEDILAHGDFQLLMTDLRMPGLHGFELIGQLKEAYPSLSVVIFSAYGNAKNVVKAMRLGVFDYLTKPLDQDELLLMAEKVCEHHELMREVKSLRMELKAGSPYNGLVGRSKSMQVVYEFIEKASGSDFCISIIGETGTGKTQTARVIHNNGKRKAGPFVHVNCGSLAETIIESELFGHVKGAFTGAVNNRVGKIRSAHGGTLFLDEVANLGFSTQAKLLNALEEKRFENLGGDKSIEVDIQIIVASNKDLALAVEEGSFRKDLYYRLHVLCLEIPPLRERKEDIPILAKSLLRKIGFAGAQLSTEAMNLLLNYDWPGNIRELDNVLKHAVVSRQGDVIQPKDLPAPLHTGADHAILAVSDSSCLQEKVDAFEKYLIEEKLTETHGNVARAARELNFPLRTLRRRVIALNIAPDACKRTLSSE